MRNSQTPTPPESNIITLNIEQENQKYQMSLKLEEDTLLINIMEQEKLRSPCYFKKMTLEEIKNIDPKKAFSVLRSCDEFADYLKALSESKKILIKKKENKVVINFVFEFFLKKYNIEIDLFPEKMNLEKVVDDLCKEIAIIKGKEMKLEEEIKNLKNEMNLKMKNIEEKNENEIDKLKNEINELKQLLEEKNDTEIIYKSAIMKENEFNLIKEGIEERMRKKVKDLKKLYKATIDGESSTTFHSKCDNIPNTITLIKSAGNRRFGGFTSQSWDCSEKHKDDNKSFLFSLDKQKIYPYKNDNMAIGCYKNYGPIFGSPNDIQIGNNPISEKKLYTLESNTGCSFIYSGDNNTLSEDGYRKFIYAVEYEIFQVIF